MRLLSRPLAAELGAGRTTVLLVPRHMKPIFFAVPALFVFLAPAIAAAQPLSSHSGVEDIYVVRSVRLSRVAPTDYCAERRTDLPAPMFEDHYDFRAVTTRPADGSVTNAAGPTVGHLHACIGRTSDSLVLGFYAQGDLNGVPLTGRGDCRVDGREFPEPGITPMRCYLDLTGLPAGFAGGRLTTNTIGSRATLGLVSDPPGYAQPSIATVRLWRRR
jgi:hypothetical protein